MVDCVGDEPDAESLEQEYARLLQTVFETPTGLKWFSECNADDVLHIAAQLLAVHDGPFGFDWSDGRTD